MKKIILMMVCVIAISSSAFAQKNPQYVVGTRDTFAVGFMTDDSVRAAVIKTGQVLFGTNSAWAATGELWTDKLDSYNYGRKALFSDNFDIAMTTNSQIFLDATSDIRGGEYTTHYRGSGGNWASTPNYSYLTMSHPSDGSVLLNSRSEEIFLQPEGGIVHVGRTYDHSITTSNDKLYVDGSATAKGYCASIKIIDFGTIGFPYEYDATNDDFTIIVTGTTAGSINLPTSTVEHGRMFNIKNNSTQNVTIENVDGITTPGYTLSSPNSGVTVQMLYDSGASTWEYYSISNM